MRNTLLFSCIIVAMLAVPCHAIVLSDVRLDMDAPYDPSGPNDFNYSSVFPNTKNVIWATADTSLTDSGKDKVNAHGHFIIDFTYNFVPQGSNNYIADLQKLDMIRNWPEEDPPVSRPGGQFWIGQQGNSSDEESVYFFLDGFLFIDGEAESDYLAGTFNTDGGNALPVNEYDSVNPYSQTAETKSFYTEYNGDIRQKAVVYEGTISIDYPGGSYSQTFTDASMSTRAVGSAEGGLGYLTTTLIGQSGFDYTFKVEIELPLEVVIADDTPITYSVEAQANVVAEGTFTQTIIPGDANWDGKVDASDATILAGNWQYNGIGSEVQDATWEMGDFNGDNRINASDATILASNWGVDTTVTSVPEPGTVVLLLSALAGLALIWRRR
ncbi:MAG: dockerin type I repeat-containing protein [Planctomycetia bacterium]|jgi:hypothetical protein